MRRLAFLWTLFCSCSSDAAYSGRSEPVAAFPFRVESGIAFVDAKINGTSVTLAMDTGTPFIALDTSLIRSAHIDVVEPVEPHGIGVGRLDSLRIGHLLIKNDSVALRSLGAINDSSSGRPSVVGFIGTSFFRRFVTEFDFPNHVIFLYDPKTYFYSGAGIPVHVRFRGGLPQVKVVIHRARASDITARLIVDLGSANTPIAFTSAYARSVKLSDSSDRYIEVTGMTTLYGSGGARVQRVASVKLGDLLIVNPIINISAALDAALPSSIGDGTIGMPVLRRTTMILDYRRSRIIFEKNSEYSSPYHFQNVSGLQLQRAGSVIRVRNVIAGTPASESGMRIGDEIIAIDDKPVPSNGSLDLPSLREPGTTHRITFRRGGETTRVTIALRRLI